MPLRVLLFVTDLQVGGTPRVVRDLAIRLRSAEISTSVACLAPRGPVADEIEAAGVSVSALGVTRPTQFFGASKKLSRLANDVDVVFSFLMHANAVAAYAVGGSSKVRLIEAIQTTQPNPGWHWHVQRWAARRAEMIVVPTASVATMAAQHSGVSADNVRIIPNAIDVDSFKHLVRPERSGKFRVGFIGRLDPIKRVGDLLQAAAQIADIEVHVFGDGAERARIQAEVALLRMADRVKLHGTIPSSHIALAEIDLLVLPSDAEGFGLVLIEAMAAGVPVVATDVPGICDVVTHESTGLLVPPRSPEALAAAIRRVREDASLRASLATTALNYVSETYGWATVLPHYRRLLLGE